MNAKTWNLLQPSVEAVNRLVAELGISQTLAAILVNRGAADPGAAGEFLDPSLARLHDPLAMRGMADAVFTIARAVREGRRILVWGDYDVDGVTGTALLVDFLRRHTPHVGYHIPHRIEDGYGLDAAAIGRHAAAGVALIVTVDCGISSDREVRAARSLGIDVVVTDHHEPPAALPPANAVLNPRRPGCGYPFKGLAGVGIAFKLAQNLARLLGPGPGGGDDERLLSYLDLVALGTVADIAPLIGENRVLVRHGLELLGASPRPGVRALLEAARIDKRPLRASQIGFGLGPRINAAGRLDRADTAVELFLTAEMRHARRLADLLERLNLRRREIEAQIREEAVRLVEDTPGMLADSTLVLADPGWHPGVIGIVAAKVSERFARPALLISTGLEPGKGSARSVADIDLYARLDKCRRLFTALGGHAHAAGFSIRAADVPRLREELNRDDDGAVRAAPAAGRIDIDALLSFRDVVPGLSGELRRLAPFGQRNPEPVFATRNVCLTQPPRTVGSNHLQLTLAQKTRQGERSSLHLRSFIGFNLGAGAGDLADGMSIDVAYDLDLEGGSFGSWERFRLRDLAQRAAAEPPCR
jgi:single-stranded-DNA-specific exonuclease